MIVMLVPRLLPGLWQIEGSPASIRHSSILDTALAVFTFIAIILILHIIRYYVPLSISSVVDIHMAGSAKWETRMVDDKSPLCTKFPS